MRPVTVSAQTACMLGTVGAEAAALVRAHQSDLSEELRRFREYLLSEVNRSGWAVVQGLIGEPEKTLLGLASLVGTVGIPVAELDAGPLIMDIKPEKPDKRRTEISSRSATAFDLHTDLSYVETPPDFITTLCIRPDKGGHGRTIISDVRRCMAGLSKKAVEELEAPQFTFIVPPRCRGGTLDLVPVLTVNADGAFDIRVRFDKVIAPSESAATAIDELYNALHAHKVEFQLKENTAYIIDNRRMVHGRTDFVFLGNEQERHLKRVYGMRLRSGS